MKYTARHSSSWRVLYSSLHDVLGTQLAVWIGTVYPDESYDSVKQSVTVPDVSLEGDPRPGLVYFIGQRLNISK